MTTDAAAETATTEPRPVSRGRRDADQIREWARAQGLSVGSSGRLSDAVKQAYDAAHATP